LALAETADTATLVYGGGGGVLVVGLGEGDGLGLTVGEGEGDGEGDGPPPAQGEPLTRQLPGRPAPLVLNPNTCVPPAGTVAL
jgi:hypothetical protein